ncbi:hypothetical protein [Luethyella okanaganae]|uniref:Uncharacterized protein n=1 Tax=Luethyella okanaganae TaxID=69372 RepID=A0ABW1VAN1_9MICO
MMVEIPVEGRLRALAEAVLLAFPGRVEAESVPPSVLVGGQAVLFQPHDSAASTALVEEHQGEYVVVIGAGTIVDTRDEYVPAEDRFYWTITTVLDLGRFGAAQLSRPALFGRRQAMPFVPGTSDELEEALREPRTELIRTWQPWARSAS